MALQLSDKLVPYYSGKFSAGANFRIIHPHAQLGRQFGHLCQSGKVKARLCAKHMMSLYWYSDSRATGLSLTWLIIGDGETWELNQLSISGSSTTASVKLRAAVLM